MQRYYPWFGEVDAIYGEKTKSEKISETLKTKIEKIKTTEKTEKRQQPVFELSTTDAKRLKAEVRERQCPRFLNKNSLLN